MSDRQNLEYIARQCVVISGFISDERRKLDEMTEQIKEIYSKTKEVLDVTEHN